MTAMLKMLMVEDVASDAEISVRELKSGGMEFVVRRVQT